MPKPPTLAPPNTVLNLSQMSELLYLSLKLSPAVLQRKLISFPCICDLVHLATTQRDHRLGLVNFTHFTTSDHYSIHITANAAQIVSPSQSNFPLLINKYIHLGQQILEWAFHTFPADDHGLRLSSGNHCNLSPTDGWTPLRGIWLCSLSMNVIPHGLTEPFPPRLTAEHWACQ